MKHNHILDEIFGGDPLPFRTVYEAAQLVVRDWMEAENCKIGKVAELLGTTDGHLYAILDPKQTHKPLSVDRVIELTALTGDRRVIDAISEASKIPECVVECNITEIMMATLKVQSYTGSLSETLFDAISDGEIDDKERERIRRMAMDEISALYTIIGMTK